MQRRGGGVPPLCPSHSKLHSTSTSHLFTTPLPITPPKFHVANSLKIAPNDSCPARAFTIWPANSPAAARIESPSIGRSVQPQPVLVPTRDVIYFRSTPSIRKPSCFASTRPLSLSRHPLTDPRNSCSTFFSSDGRS